MNTKLKILIAAILCVTVLTGGKIYNHLGFGEVKPKDDQIAEQALAVAYETIEEESLEETEEEVGDYFVNDSVYQWNEELLNWVSFAEISEYELQIVDKENEPKPIVEPLKVTWEQLTNIRYRLQFFEELDMEIYSPVFPKAIQALDGKEISIEGYIIPFEEEEGLLSLSANPFAACFFCGKASPASVMSIYTKNKRKKRYKMDDYVRFKGILHLNHDDPNEFYYILREAEED